MNVPPLPKILAFDLDNTLALSKCALPKAMADILIKAAAKTEIAVISGGQIKQFHNQVLTPLQENGLTHLENLHLLPVCGSQYYRHRNGDWQLLYNEKLSSQELSDCFASLEKHAKDLGLWTENPWGEIIENRESQVTFSALGQKAPMAAKNQWDPTGAKKEALRALVAEDLPGLEVRAGGTTSIDITRKGRGKSYGMNKLLAETGYRRCDILFFGDQLRPNGNDYPVLKLGIPCVAVNSWEDTAKFLHELLDS